MSLRLAWMIIDLQTDQEHDQSGISFGAAAVPRTKNL
jgi:hypothetical protein